MHENIASYVQEALATQHRRELLQEAHQQRMVNNAKARHAQRSTGLLRRSASFTGEWLVSQGTRLLKMAERDLDECCMIIDQQKAPACC